MNNAAPENTAALQEKIAELEQQLKLSDEGASHLAERCLTLEQKVQSYLAAHPQREMHTDSPTLLQPLLYYDAGFGFSEKDTLTAPDCTTDELTGAVTATFELPVAVQALRFDPGELPCCITNLIFSDDRIICVPTNGLNLSGGSTLFLGDDPNYRLEGTTHYPAGMKLELRLLPAGDPDGRAFVLRRAAGRAAAPAAQGQRKSAYPAAGAECRGPAADGGRPAAGDRTAAPEKRRFAGPEHCLRDLAGKRVFQ